MNDMNTDALLPITPLYFQILLALVDDHRHGLSQLRARSILPSSAWKNWA